MASGPDDLARHEVIECPAPFGENGHGRKLDLPHHCLPIFANDLDGKDRVRIPEEKTSHDALDLDVAVHIESRNLGVVRESRVSRRQESYEQSNEREASRNHCRDVYGRDRPPDPGAASRSAGVSPSLFST